MVVVRVVVRVLARVVMLERVVVVATVVVVRQIMMLHLLPCPLRHQTDCSATVESWWKMKNSAGSSLPNRGAEPSSSTTGF